MGSLLISTICHYCGGRANTQDHIVPRCDLPNLATLPYWYRSQLVVPACKKCNGDKGCFRSDCTCDHCEWAWNTALALYLPPGYMPRGYVSVQHNGWMVS